MPKQKRPFRQRKIRPLTVNQFNRTVHFFKERGYKPVFEEPKTLGAKMWLKINPRFLGLVVKFGCSTMEFSCDIVGNTVTSKRGAAVSMARVCRVHSPVRHPEFKGTPYANFRYENEAYSGREVPAICFDNNSNYGWALGQPCPDFEKPLGTGHAGPGEIVFTNDDELLAYGTRYNLMPSPYAELIKKQNEAFGTDWQKQLKTDINVFIGQMRNYNNRWRNWILKVASDKIKAKMEECRRAGYEVIYASTDAIAIDLTGKDQNEAMALFGVSWDRPITPEVGAWKIEHSGFVRCKKIERSFALQWHSGRKPDICWSPYPKMLFPLDFNILTDAPPTYSKNCKCYFDKNELRIKGVFADAKS